MDEDINSIYSKITNAVNFQTKKSSAFDQLMAFQNSILINLTLPSPYESSTADFIDNFSVKLIKNLLNATISDSALLNTFSSILENYVRILIIMFDQPNMSFIEAAAQITNPNSVFYTSLSKKNNPYTKIINLFKTKNFYEQLTNFFTKNDTINLRHISILIDLLNAIKEKTEIYIDTINYIFQKTISIFQGYNYSDLRDIDDKLMNSTLDLMYSLEKEFLSSNNSLNFKLEINIRFAKSDNLEKRFNGINEIVTINKNHTKEVSLQVCKYVIEEKVLDSILNDFHHQLVSPFISILTQLIQNKKEVQMYLVAFWKVSVNQSSSVTSEFFTGWKNLISDQHVKKTIFDKYSNALFDEISICSIFPESSFAFLDEISGFANENQKEQVFNSLLIFSSNQNCDLNLILSTISHYMPKNHERIIKESLEMISNNYHIQLASSLIFNLKLNSEQSNNLLNSLLNVLNNDNSIEVLDLIFRLLKQIVHFLSEAQFKKFLEIYIPQLDNNPKDVVIFFTNTLIISDTTKSIYTIDMKKELFKTFCEYQKFDESFTPLIIQLFKSINIIDKTKSTGIDLLWKTAFKTKNDTIIAFLMDHVNTVNFVDECMKNIKIPGSIDCLYSIIIKIEPYMNNHIRQSLQLPLVNKYIDDDFTFPVHIIGCAEMNLILTQNTTFAALKFFLSLILKSHINNILLAVNGTNIVKFSEKVKNDIPIEVKLMNPSDKSIQFDYNSEIPSLILFANENYTSSLVNVLEDPEIGKDVLNILNNIPTLPNFTISFDIDDEKEKENEDQNKFKKCQWEWNQFLSFEKPNHFIYHLNTIGNYLNKSDIEWIRWFFNTGGAFKLIDLMLNSKSSSFNLTCESDQRKFTDKEFLLLLLVVHKMLSFDLSDEINDIIAKIDDKTFNEFLSYSTNLISREIEIEVSYYLLLIIQKITLKRGIKDAKEIIDSYVELFSQSCFHNNQQIRKTATNFVHQKEIQSHKIMIQLLPKAIYKKNSEFIDLIPSLIIESNDKELIWNTLLDSTINYFSPLKNKNADGIWQNLNTSYPEDDFIQALLLLFTHLVDSFQCADKDSNDSFNIPRIEELYFFLFDVILYNQVVYYKITPKLINLLNIIIHIKPSLVDETIPRIVEIQNQMQLVPKEKKVTTFANNKNGSDGHIKGLINLGATCYMDSLLQQLYAIPVFRESLLNLDVEIKNDESSANYENSTNNESSTYTTNNESNADTANNESNANTANNESNANTANNESNAITANNESNANTANNESNANTANNESNAITENNESNVDNEEISSSEENVASTENVSSNQNDVRYESNADNADNTNVNASIENSADNENAANSDGQNTEEASNDNQTNDASESYNSQSENKTKEDKDDSRWIYELQYLFLKMLIYPTSSPAIDPSNFICQLRGLDGRKVSPHQQQDAEEYLSHILTSLEPKLPTVATLFKGKIDNHTQGEGDFKDYIYDSTEDYFDISLEVKGHKNISSSFEAYKTPDKFEGQNKFVAEKLGPIDATQTHLILKQSPVLIITLKRFQFDMKTFVKEKINTKYEFPLTLDISPILVDNNNKEESSMYELYGVIIHKGTTDAGHYISHIKGSDNKWRIFNDSLVTVETVDDMFKATYGGNKKSSDFDNGSAYILFYRQANYDFGVKNLPVSSQLIERLANDIKIDILTEISSSEEYFIFITSIIQEPELLVSLLSSDVISSSCHTVVKSLTFDKCKTSDQFCESVLSYYTKKAFDFLENKGDVTQEPITNNSLIDLVKESLTSRLLPIQSFQDFVNNLVQKIKEIESINEDKLDIYVKNITVFYELLNNNNQIDVSQSISILFDYISKNKESNIGSLINLLIKMDKNKKEGINQEISSYFTDEMLINYLINNESKEILALFIKRIKEDQSKLDLFFKLIPKEKNNLEALGKIFICILASKEIKPQDDSLFAGTEIKDYMEFFFATFLQEFHKEQTYKIFEYVVSKISFFLDETFDNFIYYSEILIDKLIFSFAFDVRRIACSLFLKFILIKEHLPTSNSSEDTIKHSLFKIYSSLIKKLDILRKCVTSKLKEDKITYSELKTTLQVEQYFYLLTNVVNVGNFNNNVLIQSENLAKFLIKTTAHFSKYKEPCFIRKYVLDFINDTVSKKNSKEFFGQQGEILQLYMKGIPFFSTSYYFSQQEINELETYADSYIKFILLIPIDLFHYVTTTYFLSEILKSKKYMQNKYSYDLYKQLCQYLDFQEDTVVSNFANFFFSNCLSHHLEAGRLIPIKIGIHLMKKNANLTAIFFNNSYFKNVWSLIHQKISEYEQEMYKNKLPVDTSVFPLMNLLGTFIIQFSSVKENKEVSIWRGGSYHQVVSYYFDKCNFSPSVVLQFSLSENDINSKGSFVFMNSLFSLSCSKKYEAIYNAVTPFLENDNGFINRAPKKAKLAACQFLLTVLKWKKGSMTSLPNVPYSSIIFNEFICFINWICLRDNSFKATQKERKKDCEIFDLLSKEARRYYNYSSEESKTRLFDSFKSLIALSNGFYYFKSDDLVFVCIEIMKKYKVDPNNWIHDILIYILNLIKNDYDNNKKDFIDAAKMVDQIMAQFDIEEIPRIQMDQESKDNQEKWAMIAQNGITSEDEFILMHLFTILVSNQ